MPAFLPVEGWWEMGLLPSARPGVCVCVCVLEMAEGVGNSLPFCRIPGFIFWFCVCVCVCF